MSPNIADAAAAQHHERRTLPSSRRLMAVIAGAALVVPVIAAVSPTAPAEAAGPNGTAVVEHGTKGSLEIRAGFLGIQLDRTGTVTALKDTRDGADYRATDKSASLISLVIDGEQERPDKVSWSPGKGQLTFTDKDRGYRVAVSLEDQGTYSTFEVADIHASDDVDVQTLLWGPLATSIGETVGESVGVVRNADFGIGLRPLTDRTEGAWPQEYQDLGWGSEVADQPYPISVGSQEQWSAAGKTSWGSVLRAFTFDYTQERERVNAGGYPIPVGPLPGDEGEIVGSKVAIFGASPEVTPTVLSEIALDQDQLYMTADGQWQKVAQASSQSFLVLDDLRSENVETAAEHAKAAGIDYLYSLPNAYGPWQSSGHYQFDSSFGSSDEGAAAAVAAAEAAGQRVGVHTLSDFISTGDEFYSWAKFHKDPYLGPPADDRLAVGGTAQLTRPLASEDTTAYLDAGELLAPGLHGQLLRIDDEFVAYTAAEQVGEEWVLTGLERGRWASVPADHAAEADAARVIASSYGTAIGGLDIIDEIADRLSTIANDTGIMSHSFDGVESASESGWGSYGQARLINGTLRAIEDHDGYITETSRMSSNTWDAISRASWGEVGSTTMEQVFLNNAFYSANYQPGMLGWIALSGSESLPSVEYKLARGAGLNAGAGFQTSVRSLEQGGEQTAIVLDAIKQWETARNLGAFTAAQRESLRDIETYWHLSAVVEGEHWMLQETDADGNPIGEPQDVFAPKPELTDATVPTAARGELYATVLDTNTPATIRFEITDGQLPAGLQLNADTGGLTGIPTKAGVSRFTVTATQTDGLPAAQREYELTVTK